MSSWYATLCSDYKSKTSSFTGDAKELEEFLKEIQERSQEIVLVY